MRHLVGLFFGVVLLATSAVTAQARVTVQVDLSQQRMKVFVGGRLQHTWRISSGRRGYRTPTGTYGPTVMRRMHYSSKYNNSPMPHSIFFRGGYAIHGTGAVRKLGRPASHGCIRLAPGNARRLYNLVRRNGARSTRIRIRH
ncbi:MAG: L,D-transpeptidase [Pseudomonadota bacterium]